MSNMERLRQQLEQWLPEQFPQAEIRLDPARRGQKIGGILAWEGFAGLEPIDRQGLLWRALRAHFNREDQLGISSRHFVHHHADARRVRRLS